MNRKFNNLLIIPYTNPDLDGTACAYSYAEFLQKQGKNAVAAIFGTPHREALFVLQKFNIPTVKNANHEINYADEIIIVDASTLPGLSNKIPLNKVIEIIDHRKINEAHKFSNANIQIESVGAAATLVAEKFFNIKTVISKEAAALLFSAIVSNTINFKAHVTTERDRQMARWLKEKFACPLNYIHEMFYYKSKIEKPLKEIILDDFAIFNLGRCSLGIAQLEIINTDELIKGKIKEIKKILKELKKEKTLDLIFLTCIDLEKSYNKFVLIDEKTKKLAELALDIQFTNGVAERNGILMRKEIVPLIKKVIG